MMFKVKDRFNCFVHMEHDLLAEHEHVFNPINNKSLDMFYDFYLMLAADYYYVLRCV